MINNSGRIMKSLIFLLLVMVCQVQPCLAAVAPKPAIVYMEDYHFSPATIIVSRGQKVVWVNKGRKDHTVTSDNGYFDSGHVHPGASFSYTFNKSGAYYYKCKPHTFLFIGMKGKVIVK